MTTPENNTYAILDADGKVINIVTASPDFAAQQGWISIHANPTGKPGAMGDVWDGQAFATPAPPPPPPLTPEQIRAAIVQATTARLDQFVATRNYGSVIACASYAASTNPQFQAEALYVIAQRDATWVTLYGILNAVETGQRPIPTGYEEIEPELPPLQWPDVSSPTAEDPGQS